MLALTLEFPKMGRTALIKNLLWKFVILSYVKAVKDWLFSQVADFCDFSWLKLVERQMVKQNGKYLQKCKGCKELNKKSFFE